MAGGFDIYTLSIDYGSTIRLSTNYKAQKRSRLDKAMQLMVGVTPSGMRKQLSARVMAMITPIGFLASLGLPAESAKPPQPEVTRTISLQTYQRILDLAFAMRGSAGSRPISTLTVRIMPAFDPESQVAMVLAGAGSAKVDFVVANENMFYAANTLLRSTGENRAEMLAPKLSVKRYSLSISSERVLRWQRELFQSLIPTLTTIQDELNDQYQERPVNLLLDGSTYELWFTQGSQDIHIRVPEATTPSALVKWAEQVHSDIANIAKGVN